MSSLLKLLLAPFFATQMYVDAPAPGPSPAPAPQIPAEMKGAVDAMIAAAVDTQVAGLKAKNNELLESLRTTKDTLKRFEGIDPEAVAAIMKRFGDDAEQKLIKEGKIEEVLNQRTERMNKDWQRKLDEAVAANKKTAAVKDKLASRATADAIRGAALKAGAIPEALDDIVLRAQAQGWTVDDDGEVVATKDGAPVFSKDGKTKLSPMEWAEGLRETASHLWPKAQGSNANGNNGNNGKAGFIDPSLSPEARMTAARQAGMH